LSHPHAQLLLPSSQTPSARHAGLKHAALEPPSPVPPQTPHSSMYAHEPSSTVAPSSKLQADLSVHPSTPHSEHPPQLQPKEFSRTLHSSPAVRQ
jgi:hypothetical protein